MRLSFIALAVSLVFSNAANATVITFDSAPVFQATKVRYQIDPYSEGGYTFTNYAGQLAFYTVGYGRNGIGLQSVVYIPPDLAAKEGYKSTRIKGFRLEGAKETPDGLASLFDDREFGGGVVSVKAERGGLFNFESVDHRWTRPPMPNTVGVTTFTAFKDGKQVGVQYFGSGSSAQLPQVYIPGYAQQPDGASATSRGFHDDSLSGIVMDELRITLPTAYLSPGSGPYMSIDNLVLNAVSTAVPEPATWLMMLVGFGSIGYFARRRKSIATQARAA